MKSFIPSLISSLFLTSCISMLTGPNYTYLTKEDLIKKGTRFYKEQKNKAMNEVVQTGFKNLGYTLSQNECKKLFCVLKTAPKEIMVSSSGVATHSQYTSQVAQNIIRDEIAWFIEINETAAGSTLVITPRPFRNGTEMDQAKAFIADIIDPKLESIFNEIETSLKLK